MQPLTRRFFDQPAQCIVWWCGLIALLLLLVGCSSTGTLSETQNNKALYAQESWLLLPITNASDTAFAGNHVRDFVETSLRSRGVPVVSSYSAKADGGRRYELLSSDEINRYLAVAKEKGYRYAITGEVAQWHRGDNVYTPPKMDVQLTVHDLSNDEIAWQKRVQRNGTRHSQLTQLANSEVSALVKAMPIMAGGAATSNTQVAAQAQASVAQLAGAEGSVNPSLQATASSLLHVSNKRITADLRSRKDVRGKSMAIFYAAQPPVSILSQFDRIVLEPDNIIPEELKGLTAQGAKAYAYLSVGEVGKHRAYAKDIQQSWVLGENKVWGSKVLDVNNSGYTRFLMQRVDQLMASGYTGLFLDTMDSYQLYAKTPEAKQQQERALGGFLQAMVARHPNIKLIANRGFEVLPYAGTSLEAIAAESLFASWDNSKSEYIPVSEGDRQWLLNKLRLAQSNYALEVISIDYLPPERRSEAVAVAEKIADLGFTPWVTTPELDYIGVGLLEVMPRDVMLLFDSRVHGPIESTQVHHLLAAPLEYYGYVPQYVDIATQTLPDVVLQGRVAGIATWSDDAFNKKGYRRWIKKQMQAGVPVAFFGALGFDLDDWFSERMGIAQNGSINLKSLKKVYQDDLIGFERSPSEHITYVGANVHNTSSDNTVHLGYQSAKGTAIDFVVSGSWGGFSTSPMASNVDLDSNYYWVVDPYRFLKKALGLRPLPMPDVTTENGKRIWMSHIDGDALPSWAEIPGRRLGAEVIYDEILTKYPLPHSISIVEAEMTENEAYSDRRPLMFKVIRDTFALPFVELATHTYSHPYKWEKIADHAKDVGKYNLPIKGYEYSPYREIVGSSRFIEKELAPKNKKVGLMLWSGNAIPNEEALAVSDDNGFVNMNGGFTTISKSTPTVSKIAPMARIVGQRVQAYAPIMNENVYTNDWLGPFDGFTRVIETFEMTDKPKRVKPLSIYYHNYAGTKIASIISLKKIYEWSTKQDIFPVYASYYAKKVPDYRRTGVSQYLDGTWKLSGLGNVRSIRVIGQDIWPEMASSVNMLGAKKLHDGVYMHTNGANQVLFKTRSTPSSNVYLASSNGVVTHWSSEGGSVRFRVQAYMPAIVEIGGAMAGSCSVHSETGYVKGVSTPQNTRIFYFIFKDTGNAILNCQA